MENKRLLLIIDPQIDFISGTLPVHNAGEAMAELARYVANQGSNLSLIHILCIDSSAFVSPSIDVAIVSGGLNIALDTLN